MSGTCPGITIKKERKREREIGAFVRNDYDDTSTHVTGGRAMGC